MNQIVLFQIIMILFLSCSNMQSSSTNARESLVVLAQEELKKPAPNNFNITTGDLPKYKMLADTTHSSVEFRTRHWGIYDIIGRFDSYQIVVYHEKPDFTDAVIEARLYPATILMPNQKMADNLKQNGFFDVDNYPIIKFTSNQMKMVDDRTYEILGEMQIKGKSKAIKLMATLNGFAYPETNGMPGFTVNGSILRSDFDLGGPELLPENGRPMVGEEVFFTANLRLVYSK